MRRSKTPKPLSLEQATAVSELPSTEKVDKYLIASRVALVGIDGFTGRLSAVQQRRIFGRNIFGQKHITIDATNQGRVYGTRSICFGTDGEGFEKSFDEIANLANNPGSIIHW